MDPSAKPFVSAREMQSYATSSNSAETNGNGAHTSNTGGSCVVRMRGLPYTATEDEIRAFVEGYQLEGDGDITYRRGEAYLRFATAAEARRFVDERNHGHVGERYVELQLSNAKALQEAKDRIVAASSVNPVIRMRGLPFSCTEDEVRAFFDDIFPSRDVILSIRFGLDCDERRTGEAFLELKTMEQAEEALGKSKGQLGGRFVDVARSSANERETVLLASSRRVRLINPPTKAAGPTRSNNSNRPSAPIPLTTSPLIPQPRSGANLMRNRAAAMAPLPAAMFPSAADPATAAAMSLFQWNAMMALNAAMMMGAGAFPPASMNQQQQGSQRGPSRYLVRVRGLPFSATEETVAAFFHDVDIPSQGVHMVYNVQDKPTGEAFVEVATENDVHIALQHNGAALGHRYIEVFRSSSADMQRLSGSPMGEMNGNSSMPMMPGMFYPPMMMPPFF